MRRPLVALTLAAALLVTAACGSDSSTDEAGGTEEVTDVTVGIIPIVDVAPIYLGEEKGFFTKRGINLTMESGQGGAAIVPGVVSEQFQFGFSNVTSLLTAQTADVPVQIVANGVASTGNPEADFGGVVVRGDSPIQTAADLAGKKVAVNTLKNIGDTSVRESVRKAGGNPDEIEFVEMAFPQMPAAVEGGQVDAAWMVEPSLAIAKDAGGRVVAWNFVDTAPNLTVAVYFTSTKLAQENPDLVARFQEAMAESLSYANAHPDEVRTVLRSYTDIDQAILDAMTLPMWPAEINRASIERVAELGLADGVFESEPDLDALLP
ncbi:MULTISPECIES: ABC transporter substrate-binding protein [unclassified Solwaraspora]|uniref:ABC transporter substrate-binding protein n=1 Tax=unclassified Solwaraspora TaxID=2627926 RepID=UPI00248B0631|nr:MULTISPECIES: ABC transporter substrate-binding protein [unclassified Solwaraspora]WBB98580.1 ABC transporter substrate-binding protein [Solwaraspora sp. WMMA2059]WBC22868.1 ABC transporter substrate-binding protein [Solwaraspora sp. WMMA2080]WJK35091.1 ABC transporter substrate-binding protein [Solwaraspora sp. WMMA2065]